MVTSPQIRAPKVRIFVDFWNFSLSLRGEDEKFMLDWQKVPSVFMSETSRIVSDTIPPVFEAIHVYGSYDPNKADDSKFKGWFTNWLDRQAGFHTVMLKRQRKRNFSKCPLCQSEIKECPECTGDVRGTEEKGIDTRIVTDMISLAWSQSYDIAVLVSSDRDFVPVADFLQSKGVKVIHAGFPPAGSQLAQRCWGSFSVTDIMGRIRR